MSDFEKNEFVYNFEFKLFTYPKWQIDGTFSKTGCDLFFYDNDTEIEINLRYSVHEDEFTVWYNTEKIYKFNFTEDFEEKLFEIYKLL